MQFLPRTATLCAALSASLALSLPALAQDRTERSSKSDAAAKTRSRDVTGSPSQGTNSTAPNTSTGSSGPGVNPNVEDKDPAGATGARRGTPPRMSDSGRANSNRQDLPGSDKGKARADERRPARDAKNAGKGARSDAAEAGQSPDADTSTGARSRSKEARNKGERPRNRRDATTAPAAPSTR